MSRKVFRFFSLIGMVVFVGSYVFDAMANDTKKIIKVGYFENYGVISEPFTNGTAGYGYEYLTKIEEYTNYKFEYVPVGWMEGFELLDQGVIDLFTPVTMTKKRTGNYKFIETPFAVEQAGIYAPKNSKYYYNNPKKLNGLTIGVAQDAIYLDFLLRYIRKYDLKVTIKEIPDRKFMDAIDAGEIDLFLSGSLLQYVGEEVETIAEFHTAFTYIVGRIGDEKLCRDIDEAMKTIESEKPYFNEVLWFKYYGERQKAQSDFSTKEILALKQKDQYVVGYHIDLPPLSYRSGSDDAPKGYGIDIMNILAEKMNIKIRYVPLIADANDGSVEVDFNLSPLIDKHNDQNGRVSIPYDYQDMVIILNEGIRKEDIKNIVMLDYAYMSLNQYKMPRVYRSATIHKGHSVTEYLELCKDLNVNGKIALEGMVYLLLQNKNDKGYGVLYSGLEVPIGVNVSKKMPEDVYTALNKAIMTLDENDVEELVVKNAALLQKKIGLRFFVKEYRFHLSLMLSVIILMLALFYIRLMKNTHQELREILEKDELTGLMSFSKFRDEVTSILSRANPNEYYLISVDIDNFKYVNRIYGFKAGCKLLSFLGNIINTRCSNTSLSCRFHDDIFLIFGKFVPNDIPLESKFNLSRKFSDSIAKEFGISFPINMSSGIYKIEDPTKSFDFMIDCVNKARLSSKVVFGNTVTVYSKEMKVKALREEFIYTSMEQALKNKEFFLMIQPKIELKTGKLVGGEVLVRWKRPNGTFIFPDEFIPLFEKTNFIVRLDKYVFKETCALIRDSIIDLPCLSVNVSACTMIKKSRADEYYDILKEYGIRPDKIELELTESVLDFNYERISKSITRLKEVGFALAIDDFGKGASSLARIKDVDVDVIKLDKQFIDDNTDSEKGKIILENTLGMVNRLGLVSLAEGIETEVQLNTLLKFGCSHGQGYYFYKPLPVDDFLDLVTKNKTIAPLS